MVERDKMVRVAIIDDSKITALGLGVVLSSENDIELTASFTKRSELDFYLSDKKSNRLDVLLLDISIEDKSDGLVIAQELGETHPEIKIIILSHYKTAEYVVSALRAKARAFLSKDSSPRDIVAAIKIVVNGGGIYFGENIDPKMLIKIFGNKENLENGKPYNLSAQELEVLHYLAEGFQTKEVSEAMGIKVSTVNTYKERLFDKLDASSVIEVIAKAYRYGLCGIQDK